jgi:hypothetical protein
MTLRPLLRITSLAILVLAFTFTAAAQTKSQTWLRGTWEGTGYQIDDQSTWTMRVTAGRRKVLIEYPSLSCGGKWQLLSINASEARFKERLTRGVDQCTNNGTVTIRRLSNKQVVYLFSNPGTREISSSSVLTKIRRQ